MFAEIMLYCQVCNNLHNTYSNIEDIKGNMCRHCHTEIQVNYVELVNQLEQWINFIHNEKAEEKIHKSLL